MKILIWALTAFTIIFLNLLLGGYAGFQFGNLVLYVIIIFIGRRLCKSWDEKQREKSQNVFAAAAEAEREATPPEGWYTCPTCGRLVRDGNRCSRCEAEASTPVEAPASVDIPVPAEVPTPMETETEENKPVARYCRKCGARLEPGWEFCTGCGTKAIF